MPAKLSINLDNLKSNILNIQKHIELNHSAKKEILVMVKADAYGSGIIEVSKCLEGQGIKYLGVAYLIEARKLIQSGINASVVVFSNVLEKEIEEAISLGAILTISDISTAKKINQEAIKQSKSVRVHIKIDTGMTRLGVSLDNLEDFLDQIKELSNLEIEGVFSHLSSADSDSEYTDFQIKKFRIAIDTIAKKGITPKYTHICNSAGTILRSEDFCNMVRIGISAYGYYPSENIQEKMIDLKGIFKLEAPICSIRDVEEGAYVSYSKTHLTDKKSRLAVIQIGYADGLNRLLSNKYSVSIKGKECKIVGNICMDMCIVDISETEGVKESDMACIFDYTDGKVDQIASICSTINYEIISTIGKRVERIYIEENT